MTKEIIPSLELDSYEFEKKVLFSLKETGNVRIVPKIIYDNKTGDLDKFAFALMNTNSSKIKLCPSCGGKHRYFTQKSIVDEEDNQTGLCDSCGIFLQNMILLNVSENKIQEWMKSDGKIDCFDLMRDSIQEKVNSGEIKMNKEEKQNTKISE